MKKLTKTTIMLLVLVLTFMFAVFANAETTVASGTCGENLTWTLDDEGTLTISGTGDMTNYSYSSSAPWYSNHSAIKTVIIENGVTSIGNNAFYYCNSLVNITIPDSVTSIGDFAFYYCDSLVNITIPDSVTSIGDHAFYSYGSLAEITILNPDCTIYDSTYTIYSAAVIRSHDNSTAQAYAEKYDLGFASLDGEATDIIFSGYAGDNVDFTITRAGKMTITGAGDMYDYGYYSDRLWNKYRLFIKSVSIEDTITSIGDYAFYDFFQLTEITIPDSVTSIGENAFYACYSLAEITIPDSVTSIGDYAFFHCQSLPSIIIPSNISYIGGQAFSGCESLVSVTIEQRTTGSTTIGYRAFAFCPLTSIILPKSVSYIGDEAFDDCPIKAFTILNPSCGISTNSFTLPPSPAIPESATIYGYENSTAKSYARQYNRTFVALECDHANATFVPGTAATCTKDGKTDGTVCNVCKVTTGSEVIPAFGHNYSSEITKQPTHEATGTEVFTCANCGDTYTETLPKLTDHAYNAVVTAPTCTEQGYTTYTCICGDSYVADYTDANGHTDETVPGYAAKCETEGLTDGAVCAICGVVTLAQEVIPATGHSYITVGAYPATCTSTGFTGITYCSVCSTVSDYGVSTPVADHKMSEWIITSNATCTADGKKIKMCNCGLTEEEVIPAIGHADADSDNLCDNCAVSLKAGSDSEPTGTTNPFQVLLDFLNGILEWFTKLFAMFK